MRSELNMSDPVRVMVNGLLKPAGSRPPQDAFPSVDWHRRLEAGRGGSQRNKGTVL